MLAAPSRTVAEQIRPYLKEVVLAAEKSVLFLFLVIFCFCLVSSLFLHLNFKKGE